MDNLFHLFQHFHHLDGMLVFVELIHPLYEDEVIYHLMVQIVLNQTNIFNLENTQGLARGLGSDVKPHLVYAVPNSNMTGFFSDCNVS
ncbi:hypothetical protein DERP_005461 [Dermatophagoides pteronyssinus]|uniref:Uncharacterized protein n=1 Tax=Dermatophagoides pteronyssinus TaxID=6956 RepID=A0ABQ8JMN7_DERPT|nr:hypothetical protein DERP_005461 [Dermatophagoides pteronyssinus]